MATGGLFGADEIPYINGGLYADDDVVDLDIDEIQKLALVNIDNWSNVEPTIFGTLFERILDPKKYDLIGAHYTSREDIITLLKPVMVQPLRHEWDEVKAKCETLVPKIREESRDQSAGRVRGKKGAEPEFIKKRRVSTKGTKSVREFTKLIEAFHERLLSVKVLDPACGSGNFLYVALHLLLDLEKEVITYASRYLPGMFPEVRPTQLAGIEINEYAQELASVVIWIGYLQWMYHNGFNPPSNPVLEPIESIHRKDAILDLTSPQYPCEPEWPAADFIIGNPPFLGGNRVRQSLGDSYVEALFRLYEGRVPAFSDLCCYWIEKGRRQIELGNTNRAGLLATQSIRGGVNRTVVARVKETGDLFFGISDRNWILDGAAVHVSMIGFDDGAESQKELDGDRVTAIPANLSNKFDVTSARQLTDSHCLHIEGVKKGAKFDLDDLIALEMLRSPTLTDSQIVT